MSEIMKSASKIVLIIFALAIVAGLFLHVVSEETFKMMSAMVFTFYFASKGDNSQPYAGK
jgi:hypothetical protein